MHYLDGHASTEIAPEAIDAMLEAWRAPGNPHGANAAGAFAAQRVEFARAEIAALIGSAPEEIIFTAGATEANNLAIMGLARARAALGDARRVIITSALEHPSVDRAANALLAEGFRHEILPVGDDGRVDMGRLQALLKVGDAALVSVTAADGEIATCQPIAEIAALAADHAALVHCDASQAAGRIALDATELGLDAMTLSSHKMHGPSGIGALFLSSLALRPIPLIWGGGQEKGLRPGTVAVPLAVGFGVAARLARTQMESDAAHTRKLATALLDALNARGVAYRLNGAAADRLPGSLSLQLPGIAADELVDLLANSVVLSTTTACSSGQMEPSQSLMSIGLSREEAASSFRMVFSRYSDEAATDSIADAIRTAAVRLSVASGEVVQ